ncbi:phage distal tail protein, Rcc01695 family [Aliiroseovarius sp. PTFE2010]|uniref:phage distal tail protein, Rcc01695 family n=1 Tax=Aliiroseovarius sp. PTFE2010 TaxID=3417190 RepID=UPI003CF88A05
MTFHDIRFPANLSFGSVGGPERRTEIVTLANGFEERNTPWAHSRRRYDAGLGMRSLEDIEALIAFFEARQGQVNGFRWKDWSDYKSCRAGAAVSHDDQIIGVGNGEATQFQLVKTYASGEARYERPIKKPVSGTVLVAVDGAQVFEAVDWSVDLSAGVITFFNPPGDGAQITAGFEFDVPVRFDTDRIATSVASFQAGEVPSVPVVEVRV